MTIKPFQTWYMFLYQKQWQGQKVRFYFFQSRHFTSLSVSVASTTILIKITSAAPEVHQINNDSSSFIKIPDVANLNLHLQTLHYKLDWLP